MLLAGDTSAICTGRSCHAVGGLDDASATFSQVDQGRFDRGSQSGDCLCRSLELRGRAGGQAEYSTYFSRSTARLLDRRLRISNRNVLAEGVAGFDKLK
jgi:hypothetical protein